ncbi:BatA domain-containing protein [Algoriphagus taiwanensis]|uniref:Aerotolerance regulator N-terminal domain-containing protein n=1 Tax=Algoriphagus taiwanensis TaxID=1445656 RepID=A0ABQ6Q468_9BACT|nr:hypothetical protein Ataiwa_32620 [Algoriphagus taiwanensis]
MEWIQPTLLWGLLGLTIPVLIHLWNGKKGKLIAWAAFPWLDPKESQSSRSVKLENWLLLLVRMLLMIVLVVLLAGLVWKGLGSSREYKVVHLIWPDEQVEAEFRFELEQATEKGQQVRWLAAGLPDYQANPISSLDFSLENLRNYLEELEADTDSIYLYTGLQDSFFPKNSYWLPQQPVVRVAENYISKSSSPSISLESGESLGLDSKGILVKTASMGSSTKSIPSQFSFAFGDLSDERKTNVRNALDAISQVYGMSFTESDLEDAEFVFSDSLISNLKENQVLLLFENQLIENKDQVFTLSNSINQNWDEMVANGLLPELILGKILTHLGLGKADLKISKTQLEQKFLTIPSSKLTKTANGNEVLLVLMLVLFAIERFLAYRANL